MTSAAIERRVAPRFAVQCTAELAFGSSVTEVVISDISVTGCGIEVPEGVEDALRGNGVLSILSPDGGSSPVMLPVVMSHRRREGGRLRFGLQFRRLSMGQMRGLIGVLDDAIGK